MMDELCIKDVRFVFLLAAGCGWAITVSPLAAKTVAMPLSPLQKISQSFSDDKLGRTTMPKGAVLLEEGSNPSCSVQNLSDCKVRDVNGVELYFSPYDGLNRKSITIGPRYSGAVRAVGIGAARSKKEVLAAAARFVPRLSFDCAPAGRPGTPQANYTSCVANIPRKMGAKALPKEQDPASVELLFDANDRIQTAVVIQSNYID
jgi:hypothetical protein